MQKQKEIKKYPPRLSVPQCPSPSLCPLVILALPPQSPCCLQPKCHPSPSLCPLVILVPLPPNPLCYLQEPSHCPRSPTSLCPLLVVLAVPLSTSPPCYLPQPSHCPRSPTSLCPLLVILAVPLPSPPCYLLR